MKKITDPKLSPAEQRLIEGLRERPEMMTRVQSILDIAREEAGGAKTADQVEELLVEEMRKLGNSTLQSWAGGVQERLSTELRQRDASVRRRKKKG